MTVVENLDVLSFYQFVRKAEISHIRATGRPVNREKTKSRSRNIIQFGIRVRH